MATLSGPTREHLDWPFFDAGHKAFADKLDAFAASGALAAIDHHDVDRACRQLVKVLGEAGLRELAWLPGARSDVAEQLRSFDVFALPSQAEGTSCTLQEAMSSARAVVATAVGGTPDLITPESDGLLVPSDDEAALAQALLRLHDDPSLALRLGQAARRRALAHFSLDSMVASYAALFAGEPQPQPA